MPLKYLRRGMKKWTNTEEKNNKFNYKTLPSVCPKWMRFQSVVGEGRSHSTRFSLKMIFQGTGKISFQDISIAITALLSKLNEICPFPASLFTFQCCFNSIFAQWRCWFIVFQPLLSAWVHFAYGWNSTKPFSSMNFNIDSISNPRINSHKNHETKLTQVDAPNKTDHE